MRELSWIFSLVPTESLYLKEVKQKVRIESITGQLPFDKGTRDSKDGDSVPKEESRQSNLILDKDLQCVRWRSPLCPEHSFINSTQAGKEKLN